MDKWDGYTPSRQRLYQPAERDTKAAESDRAVGRRAHCTACADLKTGLREPRSATVGVEFTNSSITSGGDGSDVTAAWERMRADNPHITYHSNKRGYIACTATPAECVRTFASWTR